MRPRWLGAFVIALVVAVALGEAGAQAPATGGQQGLAIASDSLIGTRVRDRQGQEIGEVSKLLIDPKDGRVTSVLIRQGGVLGVGGKEMSVPWSALALQRNERQELVVTLQQQMLEPAPSASGQQQPSASPAGSGGGGSGQGGSGSKQ
ncbi:MAG TPA: PRC-barrel domain-containing protein [Candidatus Tectomicrobia bacterium]|nr:PRC-barrel domain-containing protein [Candidatus Tectomicrobia bacterium]